MKKTLLSILICVSVTALVHAQSHTTITYAVGFPTGDVGDFISKTSFRGANFDYRYRINPNVAVGALVGWQVFYEAKPSDTYTIDNVSLTGKQYRYSNHVPLLVTGTYFFNPDADIKPFGSLGIGTIYTRRNTDMNLYTVKQEAWNFALQPELGAEFKLNDYAGVVVSAKYFYGMAAGNDLAKAQSYFTLNVGFAFHGQ